MNNITDMHLETELWVAVRDGNHDEQYSYDHAAVAGGAVGAITDRAIGGLLDRVEAVEQRLDDDEFGEWLYQTRTELDPAAAQVLALDEDDAHALGVAVYAARVAHLEAELAHLEQDAADEPLQPYRSSSWSVEAFPRALLGL